MRQALAFAYLAFGGVLITSAITGEAVGELLTQGLTPEGKARLHAKQTASSGGLGGSGGGAGTGSPGGGSGGSIGGAGRAPSSLPPSPSQIRVPKGSPNPNVAKIRQALQLKEALGKMINAGTIDLAKATKIFNETYPNYARESRELVAGK